MERGYWYSEITDCERTLGKPYVNDTKLRVREYVNATVVPWNQVKEDGQIEKDGVYTENGEYIVDTGYIYNREQAFHEVGYENTTYVLHDDEIEKYYDYEICYIGHMKYHYGHFILESVSRLWPLIDSKDIKIALIDEDGRSGASLQYVKDFFRLAGQNFEEIIVINSISRFKKIYIPDSSCRYTAYISQEHNSLFHRISDRVKLKLPVYDNIYFSRVKFTKEGIERKKESGHSYFHREYGEIIIQKIFQDNGYKVLFPEELSLEEQIYYVSHCKTLATTNGTIAHNVLFAKQGIRLIVLNKYFEKHFGFYRANWYQEAINELKEVDYIEIDAYAKGSYRALSLLVLSKPFRKFIHDEGFVYKRTIDKLIDLVYAYLIYYGRRCSRAIKAALRKILQSGAEDKS